MAKNDNFLARGLQNILQNLKTTEERTWTVKDADEEDDLGATATESTEMDPQGGRTTHRTEPIGAFLPSGQYLPFDRLQDLQGRCVACREKGEFTPVFEGNGGRCQGCGEIHCLAEHGSVQDDGRFLCKSCARSERTDAVKKGILEFFAGLFTGEGEDD